MENAKKNLDYPKFIRDIEVTFKQCHTLFLYFFTNLASFAKLFFGTSLRQNRLSRFNLVRPSLTTNLNVHFQIVLQYVAESAGSNIMRCRHVFNIVDHCLVDILRGHCIVYDRIVWEARRELGLNHPSTNL